MTFAGLTLASLVVIGPLGACPGCQSSGASGGPAATTRTEGSGGDALAGASDASVTGSGAADTGSSARRGDDAEATGDANAIGSTANEGGAVSGSAGSANEAGAIEAGGESPCAMRSGLVFCDDFEGATTAAPPAPWSTSIVGSGAVTVDTTTPAHSGTKSIHVHDGDADYDTLLVLHDASVLPAPGGRFYVRVYMRLGAAMSAGHNTFVLADLFASQGQHNDLRLGEDDQMLMYTVMGDAHGALSNANYYNDGMLPGIQFAPGAWTCLEVLLDSAKPEIDVWVDGKEIPDLHHTDYPLDDYDNLRFGFEKYAGPAMDVWYDDIAVGTLPVGCD